MGVFKLTPEEQIKVDERKAYIESLREKAMAEVKQVKREKMLAERQRQKKIVKRPKWGC